MNARSVSSRLFYEGLFPDAEVALAKALVRKRCGRGRLYHLDEFDDLLQEVLAHWWTVRDRYDPDREAAITSYMRAVVERKLNDLARERKAEKRKALDEAVSLDVPLADEPDSPTHGDQLEAAGDREPGLICDVTKALARLTPRQREISRLRAEGVSVTAISEALGTSRSTVHDEIRRIRKHFEDRGLRDYL